MTTFDITKCPVIDGYKRCKTRDGRDVRILCEDAKFITNKSVLAAVANNDGFESLITYRSDGYYNTKQLASGSDLVNIPIKKTLWVNVYSGGTVVAHESRHNAEFFSSGNSRIARIKVEYEEGQFDE